VSSSRPLYFSVFAFYTAWARNGHLEKTAQPPLALLAVAPLNFAVPVLGVADEWVLLSLVLHGIVKVLPAHVLDGFARSDAARKRRRF